jgi:hypothetical protein
MKFDFRGSSKKVVLQFRPQQKLHIIQFQIITEETLVGRFLEPDPDAPFRSCLLAVTTLHFESTAVSSGANYFFLILVATCAEEYSCG